jgi:hypothetical protein
LHYAVEVYQAPWPVVCPLKVVKELMLEICPAMNGVWWEPVEP